MSGGLPLRPIGSDSPLEMMSRSHMKWTIISGGSGPSSPRAPVSNQRALLPCAGDLVLYAAQEVEMCVDQRNKVATRRLPQRPLRKARIERSYANPCANELRKPPEMTFDRWTASFVATAFRGGVSL